MRALAGILVGIVAATAALAGPASATHTLAFAREIQNLRFGEVPLLRQLGRPARVECAEAKGPAGFGEIPHRAPGEAFESKEHFIAFAAVYPPGAKPLLFVDLDGDRRLSCRERLDPIVHPRDPERLFRTVSVEWRDAGPARVRTYRITIPARLDGGSYTIDLVDAPVARWSVDGHDSLWILLDGNHDGVFDRRYGDVLLVDPDGEGRIDLTFGSPNQFSFHAPLELPWGAFEVARVDAAGRSMTLVAVEGARAEQFRPLGAGDFVPPMTCRAQDGSSVVVGGPSEGGQLVYFWLAHCGNCLAAMDALSPQVPALARRGIRVVGVSMDESDAKFRSFIGDRMLIWPQCFSGTMLTDNPIARRLGVRDPSEFVVIGADGRIAGIFHDHEKIKAELTRLGL